MDVWIIVFAAALVFLVVIIILWIAEAFAAPSLPAGPACLNNTDCANNQVCQNGQCKVRIGGPCQSLGECVRDAIACQDVCLAQPRNSLGQPCPCQRGLVCQRGFCHAPVGASCLQDRDCVIGSLCLLGTCSLEPIGPTGMTGATACAINEGGACCDQGYIYTLETNSDEVSSEVVTSSEERDHYYIDDYPRNEHYLGQCLTKHECQDGYFCAPRCVFRSYGRDKILPVISRKYLHGENALDLTVHQDQLYILLEGGDIVRVVDHMPIRLSSSRSFGAIFSFTGHLYGLEEGHLYVMNEEESWDYVESMSSIRAASVTMNGKYLWLETDHEGYLYDRNWNLVEHLEQKKFQFRIYGLDRHQWLDFYHDRIIASTGQDLPRTRTACFKPNGEVKLPKNHDVCLLRYLSYQGEYTLFMIMERGCLRA